MATYYKASICASGHVVSQYEQVSDTHCTYCSAKIITKCPHCNNDIRGVQYFEGAIGFDDYTLPKYCYHCGKPYPWTACALESTASMINEDILLSESEKNQLTESLPDIISETPKTRFFSSTVKKLLPSMGDFTADAFRQFVIDFGCELAIRLIFK